ncbi:MAG: M67 family peptidase [Sphingomonadales bacterium]|nr:MAG: M67 family peptidase [Sphingomonadales bacterium]
MAIGVRKRAIDAMRAAALSSAPREACGILLGTPDVIEMLVETRNMHPAPSTYFEIDPQALVDAHRAEREGGPMVVGYFHSHPTGPARPSATDQAMAAADGRVWAILGNGQISLWRDAPGGFAEISYQVLAR